MGTVLGSIFALISAVAFGTAALFARTAYATGVTPLTLLFLRFAIAALFMAVVMRIRRERLPRGRTILGLILMGAIGYVGQSLSFFTALTMANAGLVALLLYVHPAIVAVLAAVLFRERLSMMRIAAVVLALLGTAFTVGPEPAGSLGGILLAINAAVVYSVYITAGTYLLRSTTPIAASTVIMAATALTFGALNFGFGGAFPRSLIAWSAVGGLAILATVVPVTFFLIGITVIGATRASVISTFEPVTTVLLAALILGESLTTLTLAGGACILTATIMLSLPAPRRI